MKFLKVFGLSIILAAGSSAQKDDQAIINEIINDSGSEGTFLLYDLNNETYISNNFPRTDQAFLPASTFKIFNSLAALETGVIRDAEEILKWDSVSRGWDMWDKDHNLRTAIKYSVVWFYQELARRIGEERMLYYINKTEYGNRDISGGIDLFWLQGNLKITPRQQIEFLKKLYKDDLPFSKRNLSIVKEIMIREKTDDYTIHAKTGWAARVTPQVGWYTGYVETADNVYFFAMNIDIRNDEDVKNREALTNLILNQLKITK